MARMKTLDVQTCINVQNVKPKLLWAQSAHFSKTFSWLLHDLKTAHADEKHYWFSVWPYQEC